MKGKGLLFFKVEDQKSRSKHYLVGKLCQQDRDRTISFRVIQLGTNDHNDKKNPIVFQSQLSRPLHYLVGKSCRQA
jgi:hypothetical protein